MDMEELKAFAELLGDRIVTGLCEKLPGAITQAAEAHAREVLARNREADRQQVLNGQTFASHLELQDQAFKRKEAADRVAAAQELDRQRRELDLRIRIGEEAARTGLPVDLVKTFREVTGGESLEDLAPHPTEDAPQSAEE